jgi:predicted acyl esterase
LSAGNFTRINASDWPVPGTRWQPLFLDPTRSGTAASLNDGILSHAAALTQAMQPYLDLVSLPTATDPDSASIIAGPAGTLFDTLPFLLELNAQEPLALTYTTPALSKPVDVVGAGSLDVFMTTVLSVSDLYAVLADVWPDGRAYAVGVGRLRTGFPDIVRERSVIDANGEVVQPYGDYSAVTPAMPGQGREYHVEFWPIGNHFATGHRLRLYLLGTSLFMLPTPGVNLVSIGGATPSRLLLPVLPDSDLHAAMGAAQ